MAGISINPFTTPSYTSQATLQPTNWLSPYGAAHPLQQIQQVLQIVPQQLQQLLQLQSLQQQQLQQVAQVLQVLPAQLMQLQQLIQVAQHTQMQPFGGLATLPLWSASPQGVGAQPSYLM